MKLDSHLLLCLLLLMMLLLLLLLQSMNIIAPLPFRLCLRFLCSLLCLQQLGELQALTLIHG